MKKAFSLAYLILCHKNPFQVAMLIKKLNDINIKFFIHVDRKVNENIFRNEINRIASKANVYWCEERYESNLGEFSLVSATLSGISKILKSNNIDYTVLISGQDFPIKSNDFIKCFFKNHKDKVYLEYFKIPCPHWFNGGINRFPLFYRVDSEMPLYGGSHWWSAPTKFLKKVCLYLHNNPKITQYFEKVDIPEESFFQTIFLIVAEFERIQIINRNYRYISWGENEAHPKILGIKDFHELKSSDALIARKFDNEIDNKILKKLS